MNQSLVFYSVFFCPVVAVVLFAMEKETKPKRWATFYAGHTPIHLLVVATTCTYRIIVYEQCTHYMPHYGAEVTYKC